MEIMKKEKFAVSGIVLWLVLLAYGLLALSLGFYWDDWPFAWLLHLFGPSDFIESFRPFRPFLGPVFMGTTALFGEHPLAWQLVGLVARFLLSLELWLVLRSVWRSQKWNLLWVVFLFTVYPAYQQQWVALTHVNQEIIPFLFLIASFGLTVQAIRDERHRIALTISALVLQALGLFLTEYFFGLEILRFCFLLAIFAETFRSTKDVLRKAGMQWLPYLAVWILNAAWTYAYHHSAAYSSYNVTVFSPASFSPLVLVNELINTISLSAFTSWLNTFQIFSVVNGTLTQAISFVVLLIATITIFIFMRFQDGKVEQDRNESDNWGLWAMAIGFIAIFAGRLPSWAAGLPLKIEFDYDRFFVSIMLGASLFIVGLATFLFKDGKRKLIVLSLLIGLCTAYQFSLSNTFRRDWENQRDFFWQLAWRIPALKENTALLTYELPLKFVSDMQLTAPLNWMYVPDLNRRDIPYILLYLKTRFSPSELRADQPLAFNYRTVKFKGNTSNSVVIYKEADGCLRVLDPVYNNAETVPNANFYLTEAIPLSNPNLILTDAPLPAMDKTLFGNEPAHDWCYTYAKAEIARQLGNWKKVVSLFRGAQKVELNPQLPVEYLPFIEAFALTGDPDTAIKLTERTIKGQPTLCPALYTLWDRVSQAQGISVDVENVLRDGCKP